MVQPRRKQTNQSSDAVPPIGKGFVLPVSGLRISLKPFTGYQDILLLEAEARDVGLLLELLENVTAASHGEAVDWRHLTVTDADAALLMLRSRLFGDLIDTDVACRALGCGKRLDIRFGIADYLAHYRPSRPAGVEKLAGDHEGWYRLSGSGTVFRLPVIADILAAEETEDPEQALLLHCLESVKADARRLQSLQGALEAMAPCLANPLQGNCAECGETTEAYFEPREFILRELQDQASFIYQDIHWLAYQYHWQEAEILNLPSVRRIQYVNLLKQQAGV